MPKLIITMPGGETETREIAEDSATIGRAPDNAIVVDDVGCSRRHCQLLRISSGFEIVDLNSRNGMKINGRKKNRALLTDGDLIEIGGVKLTFRDRSGAEEEIALEDFGSESEVNLGGGDGFLAWMEEGRKGERIPLTSERTTLGRKESNTVVLKDAMASSYHCEVTREGGGFVLRDLGSTNGCIVNGEQVSESSLNHGDRIRLGKTRFVFIDPAVADYEKALAAEEEGETDWGMMRTSVDMARVRRSRRASILMVVLFVVVLGGGAAALTLSPDLRKSILGGDDVAMLVPVDGNEVDDFSFEESKLRWAVPGERAEQTLVEMEGPGRQGDRALHLYGSETGTTPVVARSDQFVDVVSGRAYELSAYIRTDDPDTLACAAVIWLLRDRAEVERYSVTPWAQSGDWNQVRAVVTPPKDVVRATVALVVMGKGAARFDDIVFRGVSERPAVAPRTLKSAGFDFHVSDTGAITIERTGRYLLWNGGLVAVARDGSATSQELGFLPERVEGGADEARITGSFVAPNGERLPAVVHLKAEDDRVRITYRVSKADGLEAVGIGFRVATDYLEEGATLSGDEGGGVIRGETDVPAVRKVVLGGTGQRLSLNPDGPSRLLVLGGERLRIGLLSPPGEERTLEIVTDFSGMLKDARALVTEARGARGLGNLGEAVVLFERVVAEFPFDERSRKDAQTERAKILKDGDDRLQQAGSCFDRAKDFFVEKDFGDHQLAVDAAILSKDVKDALEQLRKGRQGVAAGRLESRAKDFMNRGQLKLAQVFYQQITARYPGTEAATRAEEALPKIRELLEN